MPQVICKDCGQVFTALTGLRKQCDRCKLNGPPEPVPEIYPDVVAGATDVNDYPDAKNLEVQNSETVPAATTTFSMDQVQQMLVALQAENMRMMKEFAKELRKPTEEEEAKAAAAEAERIEKLRKNLLIAKQNEEEKQAMLKRCADNGHRNGKGRQVISGQITSGNGLYQPICLICGYLFPPVQLKGNMSGPGLNPDFTFPSTEAS